ncbi:MAG TPA: prepilin peptidase [Candidatus Paceibacterota bacterium]|nr:prepilin peptidase [Candidatus Paceibacterota bacterium]
MEIYYYILIFLLGLVLGSFFNVIIFRFRRPAADVAFALSRGDKRDDLNGLQLRHWGGRSKCINCRSVIRWFDLVPVVSYFFLKGQCRECKSKISPLYPVVEISTAVILLLLFLNTPAVSYLTALNALIVLLLVLVVFLDICYFTIPDRILALLAIAAVGLKLLTGNADFPYLLISALGLTAFFAILFLVSKGRWIGLGDIKLIFLMGFLLGYPMGYVAIVSSVWLAAIFSVILLIQKKATAKTEIPFGSFLSVTTIIFIIFSNELQKISRYFY